MGKTTHRYVVNAVGKGGQIYLTQCQNKYELKQWLADHKEELVLDELQVTDMKKHPISRILSYIKYN